MTDFREMLANLRRPRLLIRAARHGLEDYSRDRDLRRLLDMSRVPSPEQALTQLLEAEQKVETTRQAGELGYSFSRHISLLVALMAEARMLASRTPV